MPAALPACSPRCRSAPLRRDSSVVPHPSSPNLSSSSCSSAPPLLPTFIRTRRKSVRPFTLFPSRVSTDPPALSVEEEGKNCSFSIFSASCGWWYKGGLGSRDGCGDLRGHSRSRRCVLHHRLLHHRRGHLPPPLLLVIPPPHPSPFSKASPDMSARCPRRPHSPPSLLLLLAAAVTLLLLVGLCSAGEAGAGSCPFSGGTPTDLHHHHHHHQHGHGDCDHHHHHRHHHEHGVGHHHEHEGSHPRVRKLPEELAEEKDLALEGFGDKHLSDLHHHGHHSSHGGVADHGMTTLGLWVQAMGCSLLVSMASLVCLIMLPFFFLKGKPSKLVVDSLAVFGAGAMLGDAFLHQLPHAFGGGHSHSHNHHMGNLHDHPHEFEHSHSHSLEDLSVGLSVLAGILLFLLVEKIVRYIEDHSGKDGYARGHGHHHHRHQKSHDKKDDDINSSLLKSDISDKGNTETSEKELSHTVSDCVSKTGGNPQEIRLRKRVTADADTHDGKEPSVPNGSVEEKAPSREMSPSSPSSLVFGYLNLFSDGVHNFTDGMALGSAFLLYGSVGGWSRTLFLLAHELPQEVGDFGILVRSGFTVSKALFFNFLSALVALAGTALALLLGKDPGHSSLIEGFTAGGFIYIAVAGVLPELNKESATVKSTAIQLTSFILGMSVALCISLIE